MRLRINITYDGTDFHGWAVQPGLRTVQGEIEAALAVILRIGEAVDDQPRLTVGGRTDAGVHARGQVAHVDIADELCERVTARRVNGVLSRRGAADVRIKSIYRVTDDFDARFGALSRRYEYRLRTNGVQDPLTARFTVELGAALDVKAMQQASASLLGLQDFTTFCKAREGATAIRELRRFEWRETEDGALAATIEADAFCHSMVRALVGAVVAVGTGRITGRQLIELRDARKRTSQFAVMPAHGLSLEEIAYPADSELADRVKQTRAKRPLNSA